MNQALLTDLRSIYLRRALASYGLSQVQQRQRALQCAHRAWVRSDQSRRNTNSCWN